MNRKYCYNEEENNGSDPCDILLSHYNDEFRTIFLHKENFEQLKPWELCIMLNRAFTDGRDAAMEDLRRFIGVKD